MFVVLGFYAFFLDRNELKKDVEIVENVFKKNLNEKAMFYVNWIDYESPILYMSGKYPDYVVKEIGSSIYYMDLDFFVSVYPNGKVKELFYFENFKIAQPPKELVDVISSMKIPYIRKREDYQYGLLRVRDDIYIISMVGSLWFGDGYKNSYGTFIFGQNIKKFLEKYINHPKWDVEVKLTLENKYKISERKSYSLISPLYQEGKFLLKSWDGHPIGYIVLKRFNFFINFFLWGSLVFMIIGGAGVLFTFFLLQRTLDQALVFRLRKFNEEIKKIKSNLDEIRFLPLEDEEKDEIYQLKSEFNELLNNIVEYNSIHYTMIEMLKLEEERSKKLLENILPKKIISIIDYGKQNLIAEEYPEATIFFCDIVNYTKLSKKLTAEELVRYLNDFYTEFDLILEKYKVEKIKTIGDCYMAATGLPDYDEKHIDNMIYFAIEVLEITERFSKKNNIDLKVRIGIHSGKVIGGVIGLKKYIFDIWGEVVNIASRLESYGVENHIQLSQFSYELIKDPILKSLFHKRGKIIIKKELEIITYLSKSLHEINSVFESKIS
ncbi:MAG: adenylate/guanylate cyclase domain-containing protein [Leptospiraceae bacterium]|nr:adenylate/guanylate cyclase domain-containing protein [Leptospiraceae bacterium]